jgi:MFS family permease
MPFLTFLRDNARWLAGGFLMTFFSSVGQTFFISLSAGDIRREYALSHGDFGLIYMAATRGSALTLPKLGQIVDRHPARRVAMIVLPMLAAAAVLMALSHHVVVLALTIYLLRLFGQGMMTHTAMTAIGRWFSAERGRAVSVTTLGHNAGEAVLPLVFVFVAGLVGWRNSWLVAAAILVVVALPAITGLIAMERAPRSTDPVSRKPAVRDWTRAEVLRDPLFYLLLMGVMAPGFIGTTIFFHQVHLVEMRGWSLEVFATSFTFMAAFTIACALIAGQLIDRFSAVALLPSFLVPLGLSCLALAWLDGQWAAFLFMGLLGISYGFSLTLFGALWPEIYGLKHLGSIRAVIVAILVFATAMGPGLTGYLIDRDVSIFAQVAVMGMYCFVMAGLMSVVARRISRRSLPAGGGSATSPR